MKTIRELRRRLERLLTAPGEELGRFARFLRFQLQLWRFCARRLKENNATAMSAALSFRTIFAAVPVLVLAFLVLRSAGVLGDPQEALDNVLRQAGFGEIQLVAEKPAAETRPAVVEPDEGEEVSVAEWIGRLVERVESRLTLGRVGPIGVVLLVWTSVSLLTTLERSLNRIFEAPRSRSLGRRGLMYWSALTLIPLLLVAASYAGRRASAAVVELSFGSALLHFAGWLGPVLVGLLILTAVYKLIPNTRVSTRAAIGGAAIALPLWLLAKWGLSVYVNNLVARGHIYGTLGLLPLFLIWVNASWLIFLFGGQLAYTAANLRRMESAELAERMLPGPSDLLATAVAVAAPYEAGRGPVSLSQVCDDLDLPAETARRLLDRLVDAGIVCPLGDEDRERYILARPAAKVGVLDVMEMGGGRRDTKARTTREIKNALKNVRQRADESLGGVTLADLLGQQQAGGTV
ncbi:MAG: YhjD/YihY/BrkB family envelope integrity protein [Phycisphaerae bacterium]